jgi:hypothetical protein
MWRSSSSLGDTLQEKSNVRDTRTRRASVRWRVVALVGLALLLIVALLGGWAYFAAPDDAGLRGTVWKHQKGNASITLEFSRLGYLVGNPVVKYTITDGSASGGGSVTYTIVDEKTLSLASGEKLTIDRISSEELVLSGGLGKGTPMPWKFDKTEFTRQK